MGTFSSGFRLAAGIGLIGFLTFSTGVDTALAMDESCAFVEKRFVCADGSKDKAAIARALASAKTTANLRAAGPGQDLFADGDEREAFRRSVERARRDMQRNANKQFRNYRRRKVTEEEYAKVRENFESAMQNYNLAIKMYRAKTWFNPN